MRTFDYFKPVCVEEALFLLNKFADKSKLVAGGTDVMVQWKKRIISPVALISLRNIPELNFIRMNDCLEIGSATTHRSLELSADIKSKFPAIYDAVSNIGSVQVRNSATIGGNLCNAAPSADSAPPMLVLDTGVNIVSSDGQRSIPIDQFFKGPGKTVVQPNEVVKSFSIATPPENTGMAYWKHTRRSAMDLPILGVAVLLSFDEDIKTCVKARIGLSVVAPTPIRARKAEEFLLGNVVNEASLDEAGKIAASECSPRTTIRGSDWYRREMARVLVKRVGLISTERASHFSKLES
ncbi:MAG: xanthine dehydrogenase family protein subunit M [Deltaproteobacteria bacterium]|nr:xanthine dehydrogenase family protein subunit M [Deltaproteobacteria bacterium]